MRASAFLLLFLIVLFPVPRSVATAQNTYSVHQIPIRKPQCIREIQLLCMEYQALSTLGVFMIEKDAVDAIGVPVPIGVVLEYPHPTKACYMVLKERAISILLFNIHRYPFNYKSGDQEDTYAKALRRAIAYLINYTQLLSGIPPSYASLASNFVPTWVDDFLNRFIKSHFEYNLSYAHTILQSAGFEDSDGNRILNDPRTGDNLPILRLYYSYSDSVLERIAFQIADSCEREGIPLTPYPIPPTHLLSKLRERDFDVCLLAWDIKSPYPLWFYETFGPTGLVGLDHPRLNQLLQEMLQLPYPDCCTSICDAHKVIFDVVPCIPICFLSHVYVYRKDWENLTWSEDGIANLWTYLSAVRTNHTVFRVLLPSTPEPNPWFATTINDQALLSAVFLRACYPHSEYQLASLATEVLLEHEDGALVVTINFRKGLMFHDGTPITAVHYARAIDYLRRFSDTIFAGEVWKLAKFERYTLLNRYSIRLRFNTASSALALQAISCVPIVPGHLWWLDWPNCTQPRPATNPQLAPVDLLCGSGPFVVQKWTADQIVLQYNDAYQHVSVDELAPPSLVWNVTEPQGPTHYDSVKAAKEEAESCIKELMYLSWIYSIASVAMGCLFIAVVAVVVSRRR